jgi:hypothetical protein
MDLLIKELKERMMSIFMYVLQCEYTCLYVNMYVSFYFACMDNATSNKI